MKKEPRFCSQLCVLYLIFNCVIIQTPTGIPSRFSGNRQGLTGISDVYLLITFTFYPYYCFNVRCGNKMIIFRVIIYSRKSIPPLFKEEYTIIRFFLLQNISNFFIPFPNIITVWGNIILIFVYLFFYNI